MDYQTDMDQRDFVRQRNAIQALTLQQQGDQVQQGLEDRNALRRAAELSGGDQQKFLSLLDQSGRPGLMTMADAKRKSIAESAHLQSQTASQNATAGKTNQDAAIKARQDAYAEAAALNTPEDAIAALNRAVTAGKVPMQVIPGFQRMVTTDPLWKLKLLQGALDPEKLKEALMPHMQAAGGAMVNTNPLAGPTGQGQPNAIPITQSADNIATNARIAADAKAAREQAQQHFDANMGAPQYMQTDAGLVALPKKPAPGVAPTATVITGPNGESLGKPLKDIPPTVNTAIISNAQSLYALNKALALAGGNDVGPAKGDANATGWKGYVPNGLLNRLDPKGVDTRAEISDIGSLKIHDRSGAAVTVSESPRLMPFIPLSTDDPATVTKKLTRLRDEVAREQEALGETYSKEQGYKPSPVKPKAIPAQAGKPATTASGATASNW